MAELQAYFFLFLSLWSSKIVNFNFIPKFFDWATSLTNFPYDLIIEWRVFNASVFYNQYTALSIQKKQWHI